MTVSKFPARRGIGSVYVLSNAAFTFCSDILLYSQKTGQTCTEKFVARKVEYFKRAQFEFCSSHSHPPANGAPLRYPAQAVTMQRRVIERTQAHVAGAECFFELDAD